jgi:glycosyltransferase involved in cell wall biosynthesis
MKTIVEPVAARTATTALIAVPPLPQHVELIGARTAQTALIGVPPLPQCEVSVIIPAKDEAQTIAATLTALANQTDLNGQPLNPLTYEIIVLANNCTDESATIARQFAQQHPDLVLHIAEMTLPPDRAYIGHVRKMLMDEAYLRLMSVGRSRGIIASTDGDTIVSATWIAAILHEIGSGVDAVGGRILTDRHSRQALHPQAKSHFLQEVGYRSLVTQVEFHLDPDPYDPLPRHYQHYGASLAVTAEMYAKAGGIPPVRTPEDEAFYQALLQVDARFRHSPLVQVTTSARLSGRSPVGLAAQLCKWTEMSEASTFKVEPVAATIDWFRSRRKLRSLWQGLSAGSQLSLDEVEPLAGKLGISATWLFAELLQDRPFGKLFERVTQRQHQSHLNHWQPIDIMTAISELREYLAILNHHVS